LCKHYGSIEPQLDVLTLGMPTPTDADPFSDYIVVYAGLPYLAMDSSNITLSQQTEKIMLWTIIIILLVLWALGFGFAGQAVGSLIHILLVIAVIVLVLQLVRGRRGV
jgi:hypothetical protein